MFSVDKLNSIVTPYYYYDTQLLRKTLEVIKQECEKHENFHVHYAVKANANPKILRIISQYGFDDKSVAHEMYYAFVSDPGNYCKYVLGMLGFEQLKTKAQSELSDKFNLKNFHQYILDMGPVQFDILFNNLDAWIKKEK